jgi:hypothetical protein
MDDWRVSNKPIPVPDYIAIERTDETLVWERIWTKPVPQLPSLPMVGHNTNIFTTTKARNATPHP